MHKRVMTTVTTLVSSRVVEAVADAKGVDEETLPPLYETLDSDALDALFNHRLTPSVETPSHPTVQFSYAGLSVVVRSETDIEVEPEVEE